MFDQQHQPDRDKATHSQSEQASSDLPMFQAAQSSMGSALLQRKLARRKEAAAGTPQVQRKEQQGEDRVEQDRPEGEKTRDMEQASSNDRQDKEAPDSKAVKFSNEINEAERSQTVTIDIKGNNKTVLQEFEGSEDVPNQANENNIDGNKNIVLQDVTANSVNISSLQKDKIIKSFIKVKPGIEKIKRVVKIQGNENTVLQDVKAKIAGL